MFAKQFENKPVFYAQWLCELHSLASIRADELFHAPRSIDDISKRSLTTSINIAQSRLFLFKVHTTSDATYHYKQISGFHNTSYANEWQTLPS